MNQSTGSTYVQGPKGPEIQPSTVGANGPQGQDMFYARAGEPLKIKERTFADDYPSTRVPLKINHESNQGYIVNLREGVCGGVSIIESNAGTVRSNHYHKEDSHTLYVVSGALLYFERPIGQTRIDQPLLLTPGQMFFTPPLKEHAIVFLFDSTMISVSARQRDHSSHEADVVRVPYLNQEQVDWWYRWGRAHVSTMGSDVSKGYRKVEHHKSSK